MHGKHPISNILSPHIPIALPSNQLQMCYDNVPEGICHEACCSIWGKPLLSSICEYSALCSCLFPLKVGKDIFCIPPKVDSSVVEIKPRKPHPKVNPKEWDGFIRICFIKKNKTIGFTFKQKNVVSLLQKNHKTFQALQVSHSNSSLDEAMNMISLGDQSMVMDDDDNEVDKETEMDDT